MAYQLKQGISFCTVAGRCIFLDVPSDRYFALAEDAEASFLKLVEGRALTKSDLEVLSRLGGTGPLTIVDGEQSALATRNAPPAVGSLLDHLPGRSGVSETVRALWHLRSAERSLRRLGLAGALTKVAARKQNAPGGVSQGRVEAVAAGFRAASAFSTKLDQCLPRSLAVAARLLAIGGKPDLIIGVKLQPFQAHCWVQIEGQLVNEWQEVASAFTPILAL